MNFINNLTSARKTSLFETCALIIALLAINYNFCGNDMGFLSFSFNPFWLIIFWAAPGQKFPNGLISSAIVAFVFLIIAYFRMGMPVLEFLTDISALKTSILFLLTGYYLSLIRENFDYEIKTLEERNDLLAAQLNKAQEINSGISEDDKANALKIFETSHTLKTVYQAASSLNSLNEDELNRSICELVKKFTSSSSFAIYKIVEDSKLILACDSTENNTDSVISSINDDPVVKKSFDTGKIMTVADISELKAKYGAKQNVKLSCPVKFKGTDELYGFIIIFEIPFSKMNHETINIMEIIAGWAQGALLNSREFLNERSKNIEDELTLAYKYDYFKKRLAEEYKRAQRYNFDLSLVLVKIVNYEEFPPEKRGEILRLITIFLKTIIRDIDIASRFKNENFLVNLLPSTDEKGAMILIKRIKQALPSFFAGASMPENFIKLDFNYKVVYRKK
ncbi:MAG: diguanylate cyclase [Candidatus Wallbacteria bacterium]